MTTFILIGLGFSLESIVATFLISSYLPNNPGTSAFLAMTGIAFSPTLMGYLIFYMVNPDNISPSIIAKEGEKTIAYFSEDIVEDLPNFWILCSGCVLIFAIIGPFFILDDKDKKYEEEL